MTTDTKTSPLLDLNKYLSAAREKYDNCLDVVEHKETISGISIATRLHHLKFNGNCQPAIDVLAGYLYGRIIDYCLSMKKRPALMTPEEGAMFTKEARRPRRDRRSRRDPIIFPVGDSARRSTNRRQDGSQDKSEVGKPRF